MTISTRTPEGESLRCEICDAVHFVLVSRPPSDSLCPSCGSYSWMPVNGELEHFPMADVSRKLPGFLDRLRLCKSRLELGSLLVDGIYLCIDPTYVRLWLIDSRKWSYSNFRVIAARGDVDDRQIGMAEPIEIDNVQHIEILTRNNSVRTLVPILQQDRSTIGVVEMQHPAPAPQAQQRARFRLVRSVSSVAVSTHLLD